ncbi:MAG: hypothetical protein KAS39_08510, partial [Actinomycetia bacterium]|nr:hypothetical protein [Actinomycetes bacterium]
LKPSAFSVASFTTSFVVVVLDLLIQVDSATPKAIKTMTITITVVQALVLIEPSLKKVFFLQEI